MSLHIIKKLTKNELQSLLDNNSSYTNIMRKLGISYLGGANHKELKKKIGDYECSLELFNENKRRSINEWAKGPIQKTSLSELLVCDSHRNIIPSRLYDANLLKNQCYECGQMPVWNGKPLTLQIDHINGIHSDNRIENLRILCPNCHTQTLTYGSKRNKKYNVCVDCGSGIRNKSTRCVGCSNKRNTNGLRKFEVSKEELEKLIAEKPMTQIGKLFDVSDNAIRKRARLFGLLT